MAACRLLHGVTLIYDRHDRLVFIMPRNESHLSFLFREKKKKIDRESSARALDVKLRAIFYCRNIISFCDFTRNKR